MSKVAVDNEWTCVGCEKTFIPRKDKGILEHFLYSCLACVQLDKRNQALDLLERTSAEVSKLATKLAKLRLESIEDYTEGCTPKNVWLEMNTMTNRLLTISKRLKRIGKKV